jgi:hypothetical protein
VEVHGPSKKCCTCRSVKPVSDFNVRRGSFDGLQSRCRDCARAWYVEHRQEHIENAGRRKKRAREERREKLARYLQLHPCVDCGETDLRCLDFDHLDPTNKVNDVSVMVMEAWPWDRILAEIGKCVVRCANCHRRKEAVSRSLWRERWLKTQDPMGWSTGSAG